MRGRRLLAAGAIGVLWLVATGVDASDPAAGYVGSEMCQACHADQTASLVHHGGDLQDANCESCHGPGAAHVEAGGDVAHIKRLATLPAHERDAVCTGCHVGGNAVHWQGSVHQMNDVSCSDCHQVHNEHGAKRALLARDNVLDTCFGCHQMQRVQMMRSSHMPLREGKMDCIDCHNPHGSAGPAMLIDNSVNDNCYRCHAEKRGPVLFEHPPVKENCLNCHSPHGSMHESMLVAKQPRLCHNCHINSRHPSEPRVATNRFVFNKSCVNCHSEVHGSNHPGGVRQIR